MTPDRDAAEYPSPVLADEAARALALATDPTAPEPGPETMARVLAGLRGLRPRPDRPATRSGDDPVGYSVPLPRRCP